MSEAEAQASNGLPEYFDFDKLPPETKAVYGSEVEYNRLVAQNIQLEITAARKSEDYDESLFPSLPETREFTQEIENPHFITDPEIGAEYAVYVLNRDKIDPGEPPVPLVFNLPWSAGAESRGARALLNEIVKRVNQPVIVIDPIATGKTSVPKDEWVKRMDFDQIAASEKRVLDQELANMGAEEMDTGGVSMGGIRGAKQAVMYGDRVRSLITLSTPGFVAKKPLAFAVGFGLTEKKAGQQIEDKDEHGLSEQKSHYGSSEMYGSLGADLKLSKLPLRFKPLALFKPFLKKDLANLEPEQFTTERVPAFFRYFRLMTKAVLSDLPEKLSEKTHWVDSIGSKEAITDYKDHLSMVKRKKGSNIHIVGSDPHVRIIRYSEMAHEISMHLAAAERRRSKRIKPMRNRRLLR